MTSIYTGLVFWLGAAVAARTLASAPVAGSWEKLYETPGGKSWIGAVWLASDGSWRAAGPGFIVSGGTRATTSTDLGDFRVTSFGEDAAGIVVAVGNRQAIWEEAAGGFRRVHERTGPAPKGRASHEDVLDGVGYLDPDRPDRLVAFGSLHLSLTRDQGGSWQRSDDDALAKRGTLGPDIRPPPGCHIVGWHWLDDGSAFFACHEGGGFVYEQPTAPVPVGRRLPGPCQTSIVAATRSERNLFIACGSPARVWRSDIDLPKWSPVAGVSDVTALKARGRCLLVGTRRTVFRRCE
jgi:hypothetical protein